MLNPISRHWSLMLPPENIRKPKVSWCFQGVSKETSDMKWVKHFTRLVTVSFFILSEYLTVITSDHHHNTPPRKHRTYIECTWDVQKTSRTSSERLMYVQSTSCVYCEDLFMTDLFQNLRWPHKYAQNYRVQYRCFKMLWDRRCIEGF